MTQPPDSGEPTTRYGDPGPGGYGQQGGYQQQPYGQQGQYGPPPGQQGQYGQQGRYSAAANAYGAPVGSGARFGVVGATLAGVGAIVLIIAFTALDWYKATPSSLGDVSDNLDGSSGAAGLASSYFSWLAWLLAIALVIVAIGANLPSPASGPLRALGGILAAAAIAITFFAIKLDSAGIPYTTYLKNLRLGFYFALAGFVIAGIGALVGPKHA
ncbi:MAG: hypothetical protein ACRDVG_01120 [Jatrophihabitantaceae bacterium]